MISPAGVLKILDFGIARVDAQTLTETGTVVGTINYMAPEQITGSGADERSDIFAVGAVMYELLTGCQAFRGDSQLAIMHAVLHHTPDDFAREEVPAAIQGIVRRCLRKAAVARFQTATELSDALRTWSASPAVRLTESPADAPLDRPLSRYRLAIQSGRSLACREGTETLFEPP